MFKNVLWSGQLRTQESWVAYKCLYLLSFKRFLKRLTHFMFFKGGNNSRLIGKRMNTMGIMLARELTPKDFLALIAFIMNFRFQWKDRVSEIEYRLTTRASCTQRVDYEWYTQSAAPLSHSTPLVARNARMKVAEGGKQAGRERELRLY